MNERIEYRLAAKPDRPFDPLAARVPLGGRGLRWKVEGVQVEVREVSDRGTREVVHVYYLRSARG